MRFEFSVTNHGSVQSLAEMEVWPPPQGTEPHIIPLDIDLRFDEQVIQFPLGDLTIHLTRAELHVVLEGDINIVRNSKFGDELNESYVVADVTQSVKDSLDFETETGVQFDVTISKNPFGKIYGFLRRKRKSKKQSSVDKIAKVAVRHYRIVARNRNRWTVLEPTAPYILSGRYLGEHSQTQEGYKSSPLCLLTLHSAPAVAKIFLRANFDSLAVAQPEIGRNRLSKNKKAIVAQILRTCIKPDGANPLGIQETHEKDSALLCYSELRCERV